MLYSITTATKKINQLRQRIRAVQGGTGASKTVSILLLLIDNCQSDTTPTLTSVVSESFPHLKRGVMKDFLMIMKSHNYFKDAAWNRSDYTYSFETGSKIEFFSADQPGKVRGPRRDRLFINEANNVPYETFDQLEVRTNDFVYIDWNPVSSYWFDEEVKEKRNDVGHCIVTYKDNEALSQNIVQSIEQRKGNKNWLKVYGLGELGEISGKIFNNWQFIDDIPHEARLMSYGLDFGYSNDPTAIVAIYAYNGGYILDEITFQKGLSNKQIADILKIKEQAPVMADSAEPKSIDEIYSYGINILPSPKGPGSVQQGIQYVQGERISVTKRSVNVIKEYRNYLWQTDKDGKILNVPEHHFSHSLDAIRYGMMTKYKPLDPKKEENLLFQKAMREKKRKKEKVMLRMA